MAEEVRMPSLGQTSDELRILKWFKIEGDCVTRGEPLLEVETDKATLEVESAVDGILLKIVTPEGEVVQAGTIVAYTGMQGDLVPVSETPAKGPARVADTMLPSVEREAQTPGRTLALPKVLASPAARQLAKVHGLELGDVRGSGPDGRIEKEDVLRLVRDQEKGI